MREEFEIYKVVSLNKARSKIPSADYEFAQEKVSVFISYKHSDLEDLKGIIF